MKYITLITTILLTQIVLGQLQQNTVLEDPKVFNSLIVQNNVWGKKIFIGKSAKGKPIYGYYYNRGGVEKAMVIAGVHGSEFYGVDVANRLKDSLDNMKIPKSKWKILIIPELFVDNILKGRDKPLQVNYGRKTCNSCHGQKNEEDCQSRCVDPNRQMPSLNNYFKIGDTLSCLGDKIEIENQYLLYVTQKFNPSRIISLHCKNSFSKDEIGLYADPRTDNNSLALGFFDDALMVLKMAFLIKENNGVIFGNFIDKKFEKDDSSRFLIKKVSYFNPVYPQDPPAQHKGSRQSRHYEMNGGKISFGTWASTEIKGEGKQFKSAATTITVELPQKQYFYTEIGELRTFELEQNTVAYVKAIKEVFLEIK